MSATNAMIQTQNVRTPVSQVPGVGKKDALYLWSAYQFATGNSIGQYNVFLVQQGLAGQGYGAPLTSRETSVVTNPGQVPLDQRWECFDIGVEILPAPGSAAQAVSIAQATELYSKLQLAFVRGQTQLIQLGPISLFPGGSGVNAAVDAADAGTTASAGNGFPSIGARRHLGRRTLVLNPGDTWNMAFVVANAGGFALDLGVTDETPNRVDVRVSMWIYRDLGLTG